MGLQDINTGTGNVSGITGDEQRLFMKRLLADLRALDFMLSRGDFETEVRRIGAEQELVLVDSAWQPACKAVEILERLGDSHVTTEVGKFNLEFNLDPVPFGPGGLDRLYRQSKDLLALIRGVSSQFGADLVMTGILPTLQISDMRHDYITPRPRYYALNDALRSLRGEDFELRIKGTDDLTLQHQSIMLEALNTSFQLHFQVTPAEFPLAYNLAQLLTAPILACAVNSPVLFGKRLWSETRIAIFQQAVDTRGARKPNEREQLARVRFGEGWINQSVMEIFKNDVARFRMLFGDESNEDPFVELEAGRVPKLKALQTFNSTVYRWNRACYGITDGKPHLRIECRVLPAGPSLEDEIANGAFWWGMMYGGMEALTDVAKRLDFESASGNFTAAAREGLACELNWLDGQSIPARNLILEQLLPLARQGWQRAGVSAEEVNPWLEIIEQRVKSRQTGAKWIIDSGIAMKGQGTRAERLSSLTAAMNQRQKSGKPVHTWPLAELRESGSWSKNFQRVGQYMSTDLFTVQQEDLVDLVAAIMDWEYVRHVPVEDAEHRLVGLVSYRSVLRVISGRSPEDRSKPLAVADIMETEPITAHPDTPTLDAIELMRKHRCSCLPIVKDGRLVGIVSELEFLRIAEKFMMEAFRADSVAASDQGSGSNGGTSIPSNANPQNGASAETNVASDEASVKAVESKLTESATQS